MGIGDAYRVRCVSQEEPEQLARSSRVVERGVPATIGQTGCRAAVDQGPPGPQSRSAGGTHGAQPGAGLERCVDAQPAELGTQVHRVESPVVRHHHTTAQSLDEVAGELLEPGCPACVGCSDAVDGLGPQIAIGIDERHPLVGDAPVRIHVDDRDLRDAVVPAGENPGGLGVDDGEAVGGLHSGSLVEPADWTAASHWGGSGSASPCSART